MVELSNVLPFNELEEVRMSFWPIGTSLELIIPRLFRPAFDQCNTKADSLKKEREYGKNHWN
jgi:hypothetical protein